MSYPGTPSIRIGYMAPNLPYPVRVHLPPISGPETRTTIRTTGPDLDIVVPKCPLRHEKLGMFLEAWGALESTMMFILLRILPIEMSDANLIIPKLGTKNALDLFEGLALRRLSRSSSEKILTFLDRIRKLNTKRNILVHGYWVLEANVVAKRGEAHLLTQFLREVTPTDPEEGKAMGNPRNQRERVRYTFTVKRIESTTRDTNSLNREICEFIDKMEPRELSTSELLQRLSMKQPYQVKYV